MAFFERRILTEFDASTAGFDRGARRMERQLARLQRTTDTRLGQIDRRFERAGRAALRMGTALGAVFGVVGAGQAIASVRNYAEAWRQAERSLTAAGFAVDGNREKLAKLAIRVRGDFEATNTAVARFARVTGDDLDTSIRRVETLQKLLAIGGASTSERQSAVIQLTQGLRSGQLGGEELRAIKEAAPVEFLDALARRAGGTRAELKQLGAQGKLTTDVITGALDDLAASADREFGALAISGTEAVEVLQTGFAAFFGRLDQQVGATATLNRFLVDTGTFLSDDAEAAATFAKGLEVAAVAAASLAGGKALGAVTAALRAGAAARAKAVATNEALAASEQKAVAAAQARVVTQGQRFAAAQRELRLASEQRSVLAAQVAGSAGLAASEERLAATKGSLAAATLRQERAAAAATKTKLSLAAANTALTAAEARAAAATNALTIAEGRLSAATRITSGAMTALKGALAFFGGVPGLIFAAVSAAAIYSTTIKDQGERLDALSASLAEVRANMERVRGIQGDLESDTDALKEANGRLTTAIEAQQPAAIDTARIEIDAINRRIAKNRELKAEYEHLLKAQLAAIGGQLGREREDFQSTFGSLSAQETRNAILPPGGSVPSSRAEADARLRAAQLEHISRLEDDINRKVADGLVLSDREQKFLETRVKLRQLEADQASTVKALDELGKPVAPAGGGGGGGSAGVISGGGASAIEDQKKALEELIEAGNRRAAQIIDEQELLTAANAKERAYLEERQRLLNDAMEKGITLDPDFVEKQARGIAELTVETDRLRAAKDVLNEATDREKTTDEKVLAAKARLADLLPEMIRLTGDEAEARRLLAEAQKDVEDDIRSAADGTNEWADAIGDAIGQAQTLDDAFQNLLKTFVRLAASEFFKSLFDPGSVKNGSGIFDQLGSLLGTAIGGLFGGSSLAPTSSPIPPPRPFATGGFTGGQKDQIRGVVHGEEFVVRAGPARRNLPLLEAINRGIVPGFAEGGFVSPSLPPVPVVPTVPRIEPRDSGGDVIDASMHVTIDRPGASAEDILRLMEPRLAAQKRDIVATIQKRNRLDPGFLGQ